MNWQDRDAAALSQNPAGCAADTSDEAAAAAPALAREKESGRERGRREWLEKERKHLRDAQAARAKLQQENEERA